MGLACRAVLPRAVLWASLLTMALPAAAQVGRGQLGEEDVELFGFAGYRTGGSLSTLDGDLAGLDEGLSYGGGFDFNLHKGNFKLEALYSHNSTTVGIDRDFPDDRVDLAVDHIQGGILQETGNETNRFYISVLLGATMFRPTNFDNVTEFSFSVGGGIKHFFSRKAALRLDARAFGVPAGGGSAAVCGNGTCLLSFSGSVFWQWDFSGGLIVAF